MAICCAALSEVDVEFPQWLLRVGNSRPDENQPNDCFQGCGEMAAIRGKAAAQTRILDFQNLTAAFEQSPDANITRKENSHQAASGPEGVIQRSGFL
jgi:hypothetical protein